MNLRSYFGSLTMLFGALMAGQVFFLGVIYFFLSSSTQAKSDWQNYLVLIVFALAALMLGQRVGKSRLSALNQVTDSMEKLQQYRALSLIRWACNEAGTLMMIVGYQLTGQPIFIGFAVGFLFLFFMQRPTRDKITQEAQLSPKEVVLLDTEIPLNNES